MQRLLQTQVNLRAVVGDVRTEVRNFTQSAAEISRGSLDLSARTESQASSLQETAASGSGDEFSVDHVFTYTEDLVYAGVG